MGLLQDSAAARCWHLSLLSAHSHSSPWLWQEVPVGAPADMGRQEADYVWKKTTENIQDVFEFMEELGSWVHFCSCVFLSQVLLHVYDDKSESFINYRQSHVNGDVREVKNRQTCDLFTEGIVNEMTKYLRNGNSGKSRYSAFLGVYLTQDSLSQLPAAVARSQTLSTLLQLQDRLLLWLDWHEEADFTEVLDSKTLWLSEG